MDPNRQQWNQGQQKLRRALSSYDHQKAIDLWSRRTIAGLLLMPPTRHNFLHLNDALRIKQGLQ
jgi:hypothetical protein